MVVRPDESTGPEVHPGPSGPRLALLWVVTGLAVAVHNLEEWLFGMTGWIAAHPWLPGRLHGDQAEFGLVLALVTGGVGALALVAVVRRPRWSGEVLGCLAWVLLVNVVSHVGLSLLTRSPMPGVGTAVVVLLPLAMYLTRALPAVRWTWPTVLATAVAAIGITAGAFALAALLTEIG